MILSGLETAITASISRPGGGIKVTVSAKGWNQSVSCDGRLVRVSDHTFRADRIKVVTFRSAGWFRHGELMFTVDGIEGFPTVLFNREQEFDVARVHSAVETAMAGD